MPPSPISTPPMPTQKNPFGAPLAIERSKEDHQSCHAVEKRNSDLLERVHAADAGDGNGKEADQPRTI